MNANFIMESREVEADFYLDNKITLDNGTNDHNKLINRDLLNQHPISAITGLNEKLNSLENGLENQIKEIQEVKNKTKLSQFENDSGFLTEHQSLDNCIKKMIPIHKFYLAQLMLKIN